MIENPKVYLCGPINGCTDSECKDWREFVKKEYSHCIDPMNRDYRGKEGDCFVEIVENDKKDIIESDGLLVCYNKPSAGTSMEILYAWENKKPVVIVNFSDKPLSPWLRYHSNMIIENQTKSLLNLYKGLTSLLERIKIGGLMS